MHVVKKLGSGKKKRFLSSICDKIVKKMFHYLFVDRIEFILSSENKCKINGNTARVFINKDSFYIKNQDKKATRAMITHELFHIIVRQKGFETNHPILEDIAAAQEAINKGFEDDFFYYHYKELLRNQKINDFDSYLQLQLPWLSFHPNSTHETKFFRDLSLKKNIPNAFENQGKKITRKIKKGLWDEENLKKIEKHLGV